jgi:hypothetical protein
MRRLFLALGLLLSLAYAADAAPIRGADLSTALASDALITKVACGYDEFYCSRGTQRVCRHGRCWCAPCYGPRYAPGPYYGPGYAPPPPYYAPRRYRSPDCGPGWSWQDGQCKPYRGY